MAGLGGFAGFVAGNPVGAYQDSRRRSQQLQQGDQANQDQALFGAAAQYLFPSQVPGAGPVGQPPVPQQPQPNMLQQLLQKLQGGGQQMAPPSPGGGPSPMTAQPSPGGPPPGQQSMGMPQPQGQPSMAAVPGARPMMPPGQLQPMGQQPLPMGGQPPSDQSLNPSSWTGAQWGTPGGGQQGMTMQQRPQGGITLQSAVQAIQKAAQANPEMNNPKSFAGALGRFIPLLQADQREQAIQMREWIAGQREAGLDRRAVGNIEGRLEGIDRQQAGAGARVDAQQAGAGQRVGAQQAGADRRAQMRPEVEAFHNYMEQNPNATAQEQAKFITSYKGGAGGTGGRESATSLRMRAANSEKEALVSTIDDTLGTLQKASKAGIPVTGLAGKGMRLAEIVQTLRGIDETLAHSFEQQISIIQVQLPKILAGNRVSNKDDRAKMDQIVRGLTPGSTAPITINDLKYIQTVIKRLEFDPGGKPNGAAGGNLKPATPDVRARIEQGVKDGHSRAEMEKAARDAGFDPASSE